MKNFDKQVRYRKEGEYCVVRFLGSLDTAYRESLIMFFDDRMREDCKYFILDFEKRIICHQRFGGHLLP
ncbi:MAG: hypothetical protein ABIL16_02470 [candidate division WOR-3 bacterium]